jgi:TIR domain
MLRRDVFVSYSKPDADTAIEIVSHLEARAIQCWYAGRDVPAGADWPGEIVNAIGAARVMVLVFSPSANNSSQVRREVMLAMDKSVRVVPFRITDIAPSATLEYFLSGQQWVDAFPPPLAPHCERLCAQLDSLLEFAAESHKQPDPPAPAVESRLAHAAARLAIETANIRRLEGELAFYIGPIAKWKVDRATADASNVDALLVRLGAEIESEAERRNFISGCRQWLHPSA